MDVSVTGPKIRASELRMTTICIDSAEIIYQTHSVNEPGMLTVRLLFLDDIS
jgi:hypothetical protein